MATQQEHDSGGGQALVAMALSIEDFEEASNALLALKAEYKTVARDVAKKILLGRVGDVYYRALAFEVFYSVALNDAVAYIESEAGGESAYVLGAMLVSVTEDVGAQDSKDEIFKAVSALRRTLTFRSLEDCRLLALQKTRFEEAYPSR